MVWWFNTKVALHNGTAGGYGNGMKSSNLGSQSQASQHACSSLCDEVVILWRLAALNPGISSEVRTLYRLSYSLCLKVIIVSIFNTLKSNLQLRIEIL